MSTRAITPIRNDDDYQTALGEVRSLWGRAPNTADGDKLDVLMVLVDAYEAKHHRIEPPDPIDAIQIRMQELGIDRREIARVLATTSGRVSEILNRRRRLTIEAIRRLADALKLSERCLLQPYQLAPREPGSSEGSRRDGLAA